MRSQSGLTEPAVVSLDEVTTAQSGASAYVRSLILDAGIFSARRKKITLANYLSLGTFPSELQTSRSLAMANFTFSRAAKRKLSIDQTRNKPATESFAEKYRFCS